MDFGATLKKLREEKHLTQEQLGKFINISKANISKYEAGKLQPNIETINFLAEFFEVSIDYLLGRSDIRNPYKAEVLLEKSNKAYRVHLEQCDLPKEALREIEHFIEFITDKYKNIEKNE